MTVSAADIVQCANGRDKGRWFLVLATENGKALLADGKHRKVDKPKHKSLKHIQRVHRLNTCLTRQIQSGEKITDKQLRITMAAFAAGKTEYQGGMSVG